MNQYIATNFSLVEEATKLKTSAKRQLSRPQQVFFALAAIVFVSGVFFGIPLLHYGIAIIVFVTVLYLMQLAFNLFVFNSSLAAGALPDYTDEARALDPNTLPTYALMVPLYKETEVLEQLVRNLTALNYPPEKLEIMLMLEQDDHGMVEAIGEMELPPQFHVVLVPPSQPRTKPKALNVGLTYVTSEFVVVYDAEDAPDPDQLRKAVVAFQKGGPQMICLQGLLMFHNPRDNWLTRFFAAEYSSWFQLTMPGLAKHGLLLLLGGTTNHFRTKSLREMGAWDPYNVTEDADLGLRIARAGYTIGALNSVTWEEANANGRSWIKQRSRWIKGYMQTYLAHMRNPFAVFAELGFWRFMTFQLLVGIAPYTSMLNLIFWSMTLVYFLTRSPFIEALYPGWVLYLGATSFFLGNFVAIYISLSGALMQKEYGNIKWMLLTPFYWGMMSLAAWKAFNQLIFKPHYWEKTKHGSHKPKAAAGAH